VSYLYNATLLFSQGTVDYCFWGHRRLY
jgi:hypothetical protein